MQQGSLKRLQAFIEKYLLGSGLNIVDFGSRRVSGSAKDLLKGHKYTGIDFVEADNVDLFLDDPCEWVIEGSSVDAVVAGQVFEKIQDYQKVFLEISRVLKPGGYAFLVAASSGPLSSSGDYHRFDPEEFTGSLVEADLEILECEVDESSPWKSFHVVAQKPEAKKRVRKKKEDKKEDVVEESFED